VSGQEKKAGGTMKNGARFRRAWGGGKRNVEGKKEVCGGEGEVMQKRIWGQGRSLHTWGVTYIYEDSRQRERKSARQLKKGSFQKKGWE